MFSRKNSLLLMGAVLAVIGLGLLFNSVESEPMWARWLLGPIFLYFGIPLAILGAAIRFFGTLQSGNSTSHQNGTNHANRS